VNPLLRSIFALISIFLVNFNGALAQDYSGQNERILNFHSDIAIDTSSKITVTETIKVLAKGIEIQRGIYRTLPIKRHIRDQSFYVNYDVVSVKKDGKKEPYHTQFEGNNYVIYIGDKNTYLQSGVYQYEITYETNRQIGFFTDFDELYWNVTGNYWNFSIEEASAAIHLPPGADILQNACYTGDYSSVDTECQSTIVTPRTIVWKTGKLRIRQGLTVAVGFSKGIVIEPQTPVYLKTHNLLKILGGFLILFLSFLGYQWYRFGIDPKKPTVIPIFEPPGNLSPASMGYLQNGRYTNNLITASFVNLAVKGYLKISEINKSNFLGLSKSTTYQVEKKQQSLGDVAFEEQELFHDMGNNLNIDGKYNTDIALMVNDFKKNVKTQNKSLIHKGNNRRKVVFPFILVSVIYWVMIFLSYYNSLNINKLIFGIMMFFIGSFFYTLIFATPTLRFKSLFFWIVPLLPVGLFGLYWKYMDNQLEPFNITFMFFLLSMAILSFFKYLIEQPDKEYLKQKSLIEGFKMYLATTESQLIKFHNPPEMTPEHFEKMLPYAMVLDVDQIWGEKFEGYLNTNKQDYNNSWYSGGMHGFTSNISNSFGQGFSNSIATSTVAPSSSGSGGGGFSGGGGGGGGGGGW